MGGTLRALPGLFAARAYLPSMGTTVYRAAHQTETGGLFTLDVAGDAGILSLYAPLAPHEEASLA
ncbi:class I SAM-dependent rRNA methyltransferase, partial [Deinococcus sp. 6GRE01]|nr:class I SAM-dependent rRNA methyltransferase [Deinococcus sp. 6GRE01]